MSSEAGGDLPQGLPIPVKTFSPGRGVTPLSAGCEVVAPSDQHAHIRIPSRLDVAIGDLLGAVISHPCTAFDKRRLLPVVDDAYTVTGGVLTYF